MLLNRQKSLLQSIASACNIEDGKDDPASLLQWDIKKEMTDFLGRPITLASRLIINLVTEETTGWRESTEGRRFRDTIQSASQPWQRTCPNTVIGQNTILNMYIHGVLSDMGIGKRPGH